MEEFLQERGVPNDVVKKMKDDGVDEHVVALMSVQQLSEYLPRYGDCLATIAFCKQTLVSSPEKVRTPIGSLRERLMLKLQGKKIGQEHCRRSEPLKGNKNAKKSSKKLEIGWLHFYGPHNIKQVRSSNGGGTRHIQVELHHHISEVLEMAKLLFFPNGKSKKGSVDNFTFNITDQIHEVIPNDITVGEYIEKTKLKTVRMYILSKNCDQEKLNQQEENLDSCNITNSHTNEEQHTSTLLEPEPYDPGISLNIQDEASCSEILNSQVFCNNLGINSIPATDQDLSNQTDFLYPQNEEEESSLQNEEVSSLPDLNLMEVQSKATCFIRVHRSDILNELIQVFMDSTILKKTLQFSFVDELGRDAKGVSRDIYSGFWETFLLRFTDGEDFRIPVLSNILGDTEWEAIGRILLKGYEDHKYYPGMLAPAFSVALCHGETAVSQELLRKSFMSYLPLSDREMIESALHEDLETNDELLEFLDRFECRSIPSKENLMPLLLQIAHRVIIQEPKYVIDSLQRVGMEYWRKEFPTVDCVLQMYENLEPTVQKVLSLFKANPITKEQNDAFKYLQKFVRGRNKPQLRFLLRFLTGSDMICVQSIEIMFVVRHGIGRAPTAHTCGPVLELPSTYINFPDFRNEWESILQGKENIHMTLA